MKEIKKVLYLFPSYLYILSSFTFFVFKYFVEQYKIINFSNNMHDFVILLFMLMCISILAFFIQIVYAVYHLSKNKKIKTNEKYIWLLLICLFNFISLPYYGLKNIFQDKKSKFKTIIYYVVLLVSLTISFIVVKKVLK